jgi:hypothetical protein
MSGTGNMAPVRPPIPDLTRLCRDGEYGLKLILTQIKSPRPGGIQRKLKKDPEMKIFHYLVFFSIT